VKKLYFLFNASLKESLWTKITLAIYSKIYYNEACYIKKSNNTKSESMGRVVDDILETAKGLKIAAITIKEIEVLKLPEMKLLKPSEIKETRLREKVSQAVMAKVLNVTPSTYQNWERGEVHPKGANLKLLWLVHNHGIDYILT